jgi:hypothetical protein
MNNISKGIYKHYKGNLYEVIDFAKHSDTQEMMIVYRALHGNFQLYVREITVFAEQVEIDGTLQERFARVEDHAASSR